MLKQLLDKYRKPLPYLLMGLAFIFGGIAGGNESLLGMGCGFLALAIMFIWEAETAPALEPAAEEAVSRTSDR